MAISYNGLWKLLIDKNMKKTDLIDQIGISSGTLAKMGKNEEVALSVLTKICEKYDCTYGELISYEKDKNNNEEQTADTLNVHVQEYNSVWCRKCNIETNENACPVCGEITVEDIPVEIYWCKDCSIPIIQSLNQADKGICPVCGGKTKYLTTDLRPVFPEERLLLEILLDKEPNTYAEKSVWCVNSRYYIDGKSVSIPSSVFQTANTDAISQKIEKYKSEISYEYFDKIIDRFVKANRDRLNELKDEAFEFVRDTAAKFDEEKIVISFSGGKDSTATADVVVKALSNPSLVHIFGNTTLEFMIT